MNRVLSEKWIEKTGLNIGECRVDQYVQENNSKKIQSVTKS